MIQKSYKTLCIGLIGLLLASELCAQRPPRGRFRRPRGRPTQKPPKPETKKEKKVESWLALKGGDVYVGTGQLIRRATILLADDKIDKIGPGIEIPKEAKIMDVTGKVLCPGFVAVKGRGMGAPPSLSADDPKDSVNPFDPQIKMGLAAGVTSFLQQSSGGSSSPSGNSAVFKLAYGDISGMVLKRDCVKSMRVPLTMAQMKTFRDLLKKTRQYQKDLEAYNKTKGQTPKKPATTPPAKKKEGKKEEKPKPKVGGGKKSSSKAQGSKAPKPPKGAEDLIKIMKGELKLWISCSRGFDNDRIRQAMRIAELLGVGVVLDSPTTAWSIADEVAATGSMAILNPRENKRPDPARRNTTGSNIAMAHILSQVGVPVAVFPPGGRFGGAGLGTGGILGQDLHTLHIDAAYAVRGGLDNRKALRTITLDAARMAGVESRVGSLEAGKDADILILDGDPLHYRTFVQTAIVNGKVVYEKHKEPYYSHIKR